MMIGEYPCCDAPLMLCFPERTPAYRPEECPNCGAKVWHVFEKLDPRSYLEADFLKEYTVDMDKRTVEKINNE